ncbi:magnesium transporter MgtE N-terminal domain-containing protein [Sedimentibacter saalensis]|uniref:magnesium transporter MgtE N-terminal domain-containing protein n=1 Tax=Sedimentibacter saalensis TaxID=130788 RepID=UPI0028A1244B|nr:CBS domain-containing protein [Sedimentibacter saalensis]
MLEERQEELINSVLEDDKEKIHEITDNMYPIDIAIIIEEFDDESLMKFNEHIDNELMAEIIEQASEELQVRIIKLFEFKSIVHLFSYMSNDDIADILGNLPIKMRKDLLKLMKTGDTRQLQELLGYDEDSAGGIMTTEYIALRGDLLIGESLKKIKEIGPKTEVIETIFVLNNNKELIGTADLRDILVAPEDEKLLNIMNDNIISVHPEEDQEKVSLLVSKYDLKAIPVIN